MSNKSKSSKSPLGRPLVIDLVSDTEDDEPSTSTNLISPMDTGYLKVDLTRLAKMEKNGKLSHVTSFQALYQVLRSTGDSWLHDLQEPDWAKCIFTGHPGTLRPKAAELTSLQPPGNHVYFVGGAAVVEALLRTAQFFRFPDALIRRLKQCHPNYRPPPALLHAALTEGVPTMSSLTATSSSIDICCDTPHSERVELETFLQQPPIALEEPVSHPNSTVWKGLPFVREFRRFQRMLYQQSSTLFQDFSHFFKELKRVDSRWRFHSFARSKIPDAMNRSSLVEERINVYVRGNHNIPARDGFKGNLVEDFDFFVGESRLLQYCALRCLRLGDIALCKAIAKVRKEAFYPDYASNIDWDRRRSTPSLALSTSSRSSSSAAASCPQLPTSSSSSSSSSSVSQRTERSDVAHYNATDDAEARKLITQLLDAFSQPTPLSHPSDIKDVLFYEDFYHLHGAFQNGAWNVSSFMDLYSMLREANDRWRFVTEQNLDASGQQRASRKKGYVVEALDPTAVRVYCRRFGARASEYAKQQKDIDYFLGDDRLLQYVGMQTLQYGSLALASEIADIRERFRSGSFPLVSNNDAPVRTTEDINTPPTTRHPEEETLVNNDTTAQQQDATVLSKSRPLSPTSSERQRKRRRQSAPSQDAATSADHTALTQNGHGDHRASTTLLPLQPPPLAPAKSATINTTRTSLPQHVVMSDEDSDEIATHGTKPHKPLHEPHVTADSKPVPPSSLTRQRLMCSKSRDNRNLTFCDTK